MTPVLRLVGQDEPTLSRSQRRFLRQLKKMDEPLIDAQSELLRALIVEDVDLAFRAARRLVAIGGYFKSVCDEHLLDLAEDSA